MYVHLHVNHSRPLRPDGKSTKLKQFLYKQSERKIAVSQKEGIFQRKLKELKWLTVRK